MPNFMDEELAIREHTDSDIRVTQVLGPREAPQLPALASALLARAEFAKAIGREAFCSKGALPGTAVWQRTPLTMNVIALSRYVIS